MIKKKVRDFGTPESRNTLRNLDVIMKNENEKFMTVTEASEAFKDAIDKVEFQERADHDQQQRSCPATLVQNLKETQDPIFII